MTANTEPTKEDAIRRLVKAESHPPTVGTVTRVYEHTSASDESNFEVDVLLRDQIHDLDRVPIKFPLLDAIFVPEKGDLVWVDYLGGDGDQPVVTGIIPNDEDRPPLGSAGLIRFVKGSLYFEMSPDGSYARIAQKDSDEGTPNAKVEIDDSGASPVVSVETTGNVSVKGNSVDVDGATVNLGNTGGTLSPVARKGDAVSGTTSDGATFSGQIDDGSTDVNSS